MSARHGMACVTPDNCERPAYAERTGYLWWRPPGAPLSGWSALTWRDGDRWLRWRLLVAIEKAHLYEDAA